MQKNDRYGRFFLSIQEYFLTFKTYQAIAKIGMTYF